MALTDFVSTATARVSAVNSPQDAPTKTVWSHDSFTDIFAGELFRTDSTSTTDSQVMELPGTNGFVATHAVKIAYDASLVDLLETPLEAFSLVPGLILQIPETAILAGQTITAGDFLMASAGGYWMPRAAATDWVVAQAVSGGTAGGTGYFKVNLIGGQIAG